MKSYFAKLIALIAFASPFMGLVSNATVFSTNTGSITNTGIQYTVTLEDDDVGRFAMRFQFKNNSGKTYYIPKKTFDVPGYLAVFFSTDQAPVASNNAEWATGTSFAGDIPGNFTLAPGKSFDEIFPVAVYYDKIYRKRQASNVYIYWGLTVPSRNDDKEDSADDKPESKQLLPRIGGMLTLPKKAD